MRNAGCNRMTGTFEADSLQPGKISFGQVGATRMMCPDMDTENKVLQALNTVKGLYPNRNRTQHDRCRRQSGTDAGKAGNTGHQPQRLSRRMGD